MHAYAVRMIGVLTAAWAVGPSLAQVDQGITSGGIDIEVVARVNDTLLFGDELDQELALPLHDLDLERYRLRLERLHRLIERRLQHHPDLPQRVIITLERPSPPRLPISPEGALRRGSPEASVELAVFCNFQSPECARLQPVLLGLLEEFGDRLSLLVRDLPLPDQTSAGELAEAARCAGEQVNYWRYHDALYSSSPEPTQEALDQLSDELGIDKTLQFACMQSRRHRPAVEAGIAYAQSLGLDKVPVSFVNGFYLPGPADIQEFRKLIDSELFRLGHALSAEIAPEAMAQAKPSQLPLLLTGVVARNGTGGGSAVIMARDGSAGEITYRPGDSVMPDVTLISVARNRVYLRNAGQLEYLMLTRGPAQVPGQLADAETDIEAAPGDDALTRAIEEFSLPEPDTEVALSRERVQEALLASDLAGPELEDITIGEDAWALLRVANVEPGGIYQLLDLRTGDVLMEVNGEPIHAGGDLLRRALENEAQVDLAILREDLVPRRLIYHLE